MPRRIQPSQRIHRYAHFHVFPGLAFVAAVLAISSTASAVGATTAVALGHSDFLQDGRGCGLRVTIWRPAEAEAPCPVVIYSHGLGGTRSDFDYLGSRWAACGLITIAIEHPGSNVAVWRGRWRPRAALRDAYARYASGWDRVFAIRAVLDALQASSGDTAGAGHEVTADLERIGVAGNDLGAMAAMLLGGRLTTSGESLRDPRVRAVVAMSPPVPTMRLDLHGTIDVPSFFIAGTDDDGIVGSTKAWQRRIPFDTMHAADAYLLTLCGGDHMVYGGHVMASRQQDDHCYQSAIAEATSIFWRAYLLDDEDAKAQLQSGGVASFMGRMEWKAEAM